MRKPYPLQWVYEPGVVSNESHSFYYSYRTVSESMPMPVYHMELYTEYSAKGTAVQLDIFAARAVQYIHLFVPATSDAHGKVCPPPFMLDRAFSHVKRLQST